MVRRKENNGAPAHFARIDFETGELNGHFRERDMGFMGFPEQVQSPIGYFLKDFRGMRRGNGRGHNARIAIDGHRARGKQSHAGSRLGKKAQESHVAISFLLASSTGETLVEIGQPSRKALSS